MDEDAVSVETMYFCDVKTVERWRKVLLSAHAWKLLNSWNVFRAPDRNRALDYLIAVDQVLLPLNM